MNLSCGIVGLPNVGKSTLFNALLKKQVAQSANYPFTTIEPNVGVVEVPDNRLQELAEVVVNENPKSEIRNPKQIQNSNDQNVNLPPIIPAVVKFVDIAGLVKGAAQGEGLGNQFLAHIREVDAIVFVLRDFKNEDVIRAGSENPESDLGVLKSELLLKDLETISKKLETLNKELKSAGANDPRHQTLKILEKAKNLVERGEWLEENLDREELEKIADLQLLSAKKCIYVINSNETSIGTKGQGDKVLESIEGAIRISAKLEEELSSLASEEQKEYLKELGQEEPGLNILIKKAYETLDLISFFTAGPKEVRAWTIKKGALAPQAAGVIHTDFERGFIAADVIGWQKLVDAGGWQKAKTAGLVKTIGKSEEINDGMVVEFKFSV